MQTELMLYDPPLAGSKGKPISRGRHKPAIVATGTKLLHVVIMDGGSLSVLKVPKKEERYMCPLIRKNRPYPRSRALAAFRRYARGFGASKAAMALVRSL